MPLSLQLNQMMTNLHCLNCLLSIAVPKESKGNTEFNKESIEKRLNVNIIKNYRGNMTDHASDVQKNHRRYLQYYFLMTLLSME